MTVLQSVAVSWDGIFQTLVQEGLGGSCELLTVASSFNC